MNLFKKISIIVVCLVFLIIITVEIVKIIKNKREANNLLDSFVVEVIEIDNSYPPGLVISVENLCEKAVGKTHFRLIFYYKEEILCRVDSDYGNFQPNEKREISLDCIPSNSTLPHYSYGEEITYVLVVYPNYKKPLETISGSFILK